MTMIDFSKTRLLVVGDVMLDRYWFGEVSRISPEAPVPVVHVSKEEVRPGGAANVARNIVALGGQVSLLSVVGTDEAGQTLRKLLEETIPAMLEEVGMKSFKMADGSTIEVKPFYSASIKEENRAVAYQWLRDNGYDDIIKNTVSVRFGRNEDKLCENLINLLRQQNYPVEQTEKIEPQTLKAWAKDMVQRGVEIPSETFGLYVGSKATIKS